MKQQIIVCDAKNNTVTTEVIEVEDIPEYVDYQSEINECKQCLAETDYVVIKIAEGAASREEYADIIAQRQAWRIRIGELEQRQKQ